MGKKLPSNAELVAALKPAIEGETVPGIQVREQPVPGSRYRHLTVVWDDWLHLNQAQRGKVILDAFEQAHPGAPWRVLEITLAVGLTGSEAQKLKIA